MPPCTSRRVSKARSGCSFTVCGQFAKDVPGTLDKVRDMGFEYVETAGTYGLSPEKFKAELDAHGLKVISAHFPFEKFRDDVEGCARDAEALGAKYAGCAGIARKGAFHGKRLPGSGEDV